MDETKKIKAELNELKKKDENRTCKEICKKHIVKKPTSGSRYGSGQGRCQICDVWIDYRGAHTKDGSPATKDSMGWFCNCCNYRVRQKPRNKIYKEKLRNDKKDEAETSEHMEDEITAKELYISKQQASLLKEISLILPDSDEEFDVLKVIDKIPDSIQFEIKDNWGSWENFFKLALNFEQLNKISLIILFEKLNSQSEEVISKEYFLGTVNVDEAWINNEFKSWEHILELLGYDPWYRNKSKTERIVIENEKNIEDDVNEYKKIKIDDKESIKDIIQKTDNLKTELLEVFKLKDIEKNAIDYSYVEMFGLLERYLKIIPNKKEYQDIKNFFQS